MPIKYTAAELKRARSRVASEMGQAGRGACKVRKRPKTPPEPCKRKETALTDRITTANGLLYRNGVRIDLPEADTIAKSRGFSCAERFVKHLEIARDIP